MTWLGHCMPNEKISLSMSLNSRPFLVPIFELPDFSEQLAEYIPCSGTRLYIYIYIPILSCSPLRMHMINTFCVCIFYIHTYKHTYIHPSRPYIHTHQEFDIPSGNPIWRVGKSSTTSPRTQWFGHQQLVTAVVVGGFAVLLRLWSGISVDFHSDGHICRTWLGWKIVNMLLVAWWNCRTLL